MTPTAETGDEEGHEALRLHPDSTGTLSGLSEWCIGLLTKAAMFLMEHTRRDREKGKGKEGLLLSRQGMVLAQISPLQEGSPYQFRSPGISPASALPLSL